MLERVRGGLRALRLRAHLDAEHRALQEPARRPRASRRRTRSPGATRSGRSPACPPTARGSARSAGPTCEIAILDTGIRWGEDSLRPKVALNAGELPTPQCGEDDCNDDGAFDVDDFADDTRVSETAGHDEADDILDASDLLAAFSQGTRRGRQRLPRRHRGLGLLRRRQRPLRRLELRVGLQPRHRPRPGGRAAHERRRGRDEPVPALPDRAAAGVGHVRDRHQHVRAREPVRVRQRDRGRRGGARRAQQPALRARGHARRLRARRLLRRRLERPQHRRPQLPDHLRRVDDGPGHRRRPAGAGPERRRGRRLPRRPGDRHRRAGRHLVPQLGHDAVRRPRPRRDAGGDRLAGDRPGGGRRGADRVLRPRSRPRARAQRDQAAVHDDRRGRGGGEHDRQRRARPGAARLGPALRLRAARPRARARAHRRGQDPAAGADHLAGLVRAVPAGARRQRARSAAACRRAPARSPTSCSGRRASSRPRTSSRRSAGRRTRAPRSTAGSARSTSRPCARRSTRGPAAAPPTTRPRPPRARATSIPTSPRSPSA